MNLQNYRIFCLSVALFITCSIQAQNINRAIRIAEKEEAKTSLEQITNKLEKNMVNIRGGNYSGYYFLDNKNWLEEISGEDEETVYVQSFKLGKYEVTQLEWKVIMGTGLINQYDKQEEFIKEYYDIIGIGHSYPIYFVSYNDIQEFIKRLNSITGKSYRLPTSTEWKYALTSAKNIEKIRLRKVAWTSRNSYGFVHEVGLKKSWPNGIYDMVGNVGEMCEDTVCILDLFNPDNDCEPRHKVMGGDLSLRWWGGLEFINGYESGADVYTGFRLALSN